MKNQKIILIASEGTNVGKSHLARLIKRSTKDCSILSFADPLKESCDKEFRSLYPFTSKTFSQYYSKREYKDEIISKVDINIIDKIGAFTFREFLIKISDFYKARYGFDFFIKKSVARSLEVSNSLVVFDDFRLPFEYDFLESEYGKDNILTVLLDKVNKKGSEINSYEGVLKDFKFDIEFTYTENYDNLEGLLALIGEFIYD